MHVANKWLLGVVSAALISSTVKWEGVEYKPYNDIGNIVTVCSGYTGKDIKLNKVYTKAECDALTKQELTKHGEGVLKCINVPIKENEYNAYTLFAYNVGVSGACSSRAIRLLNQGKNTEACNALAYSMDGKPAWSYVNGKHIRGLHNRRLYERSMCLGAPNV